MIIFYTNIIKKKLCERTHYYYLCLGLPGSPPSQASSLTPISSHEKVLNYASVTKLKICYACSLVPS